MPAPGTGPMTAMPCAENWNAAVAGDAAEDRHERHRDAGDEAVAEQDCGRNVYPESLILRDTTSSVLRGHRRW